MAIVPIGPTVPIGPRWVRVRVRLSEPTVPTVPIGSIG